MWIGVENVSNGGRCQFELAVVRDGEGAEVEKFKSLKVEREEQPGTRLHKPTLGRSAKSGGLRIFPGPRAKHDLRR
jgi:hypothetical protein